MRTWTSSSDSLFSTVVNQGYAPARPIQIARAGARYTLGSLTLGLSYSNTQYGRDTLSTFSETEKFNSGAVMAAYQFTPASRAAFGYNYTKSDGAASASYDQFNIGYDYALSKLKDLYALAGYQKSNGSTLNAAGRVIVAAAL